MSQPIISCPLAAPDDDSNHLHLTAGYLEVIRKGRSRKYALSPLMTLELNHRQLLGPLVGGGILTCLSFITLFSVSKWAGPLLIIAIGGMALAYYGLSGVDVLTLREDKIKYDIVLPKESRALENFVRFYNRLVPPLQAGALSSFPVYFLSGGPGMAAGSLHLQPPPTAAIDGFAQRVDLLKLAAAPTFLPDEAGNYRAEIVGDLPPEAFILPPERD